MKPIKKPLSLTIKRKKKLSIDDIWPEIMDYVLKNPKADNEHLFTMFAARSGESEESTFIRKCQFRGLKQLRNTALQKGDQAKKVKDSRQLTEERIINFKKARQAAAVAHLETMDILVKRAAKVTKKESHDLLKGGKDAPSLSGHLDNLSKLQKVATSVYAIDSEAGGGNEVKLNLAIINNFDPTQAAKTSEFTDI